MYATNTIHAAQCILVKCRAGAVHELVGVLAGACFGLAYNGVMESIVITVVAAVATGGIVGILAGMLGVGGGTVLVPVFRLLFGMSAIGSTATSLFTIIPTSISGAASHIRRKTCVPKIGVALGLGGACFSPLGVHLAKRSPEWLIMIVVACIIIYTSTTMFRKGLSMPKTSAQAKQMHPKDAGAQKETASVQKETAIAQKAQPVPFEPNRRQIMLAVAIGAIAGFASGYSGLGGGFIMVPLMLALLHMPMKLTSGTSLIAIMILALPATITQFMLGNVDYIVGIAVACGTIPAAFFGAKLVTYLPERTLRLTFACFLVVGAVLLLLNEVSLMG